MSNPLLIYISETDKFEQALVRAFLESCPGIHGFKERPDEFALFVAHFDFEGDLTVFELKVDLETVVIRRTGIAGMQLCYLFQAFYPKPLRVIDQAYNFDLLIRDFGSARELEEAMLGEWNKPAEEAS